MTYKITLFFIAIIAAYIIYHYASIYNAGNKLSFSPEIDFSNLQDIKVYMNITNNTNTPIAFQGIAGSVYSSDTAFVNVNYNVPIVFDADSTKRILLQVKILPLGVVALISNIAKPLLSFKGSATAENITFDVSKQF